MDSDRFESRAVSRRGQGQVLCNSQHNLSTTITGNGRESWVLSQLSDDLQTKSFASNRKAFTGFPSMGVPNINRLRTIALAILS